jgi:hypothetical protein
MWSKSNVFSSKERDKTLDSGMTEEQKIITAIKTELYTVDYKHIQAINITEKLDNHMTKQGQGEQLEVENILFQNRPSPGVIRGTNTSA